MESNMAASVICSIFTGNRNTSQSCSSHLKCSDNNNRLCHNNNNTKHLQCHFLELRKYNHLQCSTDNNNHNQYSEDNNLQYSVNNNNSFRNKSRRRNQQVCLVVFSVISSEVTSRPKFSTLPKTSHTKPVPKSPSL